MEYVGKEGTNTVHGTVHYGLGGSQHQYSESGITHLNLGDLNETFHTYAVDRMEGEIRWYIDDIEYSSMTRDQMSPYRWPFDEGFYFIINLAVGGNWPGNPVVLGDSSGEDVTVFPQYLSVDYVRVYQGVFPRLVGKSIVDCKERKLTYEIANVDEMGSIEGLFKWSVPSGVTIIDGEGTSRINVNFDTIVDRGNINDSEVIHVQLASQFKNLSKKELSNSISLTKLYNGIGLRIKVVDLDGKCSSSENKNTKPLSRFGFNCSRPDTCTEYVLHRTTDEYTCGERIQWLMDQGLDEISACTEVGCELHTCDNAAKMFTLYLLLVLPMLY